tara:strand:+ start:4404 stop:6350 length:1947 start_codon:yes stop_codon:yes gene_type:complete
MTTQARELAKLVTNAGDVNLGDDISLASDGAILNFGADNDVTLTHVADTGLLLNSSRQLQFGDSGTFIRQEADGVLDLTSDTEIELNATTLDINANVDISGTLTVAGNLDFGDAVLSNVGAVQLDSIAGDGDTNTSITFSGSDVITIATGGSGRLTIGDGALSPVTDNQIDLGTSSLEFKDAFFDGTVTSDAFAGPLTGDVTGTIQTAAQTNITSLGTLTSLGVSGTTTAGALTLNSGGVITQTVASDGGVYQTITHTGSESWTWAAQNGSGSVDYLDLGISGSTRCMTWTDQGKIGIGTASPNRTLTVYGSSNGEMNLKNSSADFLIQQAGHNTSIGNSSSSGHITFFTNNGNSNVRMGANGYVGIGTTTLNKMFNIADPAQGGEALKLHFEASSSSDKWAIYSYDRSNSHYADLSLGQNAVYIKGSNTNVGIGTTDPGAMLDIASTSTNDYPLKIRGNIDNDGGFTGIVFGYESDTVSYEKAAIHVEGTSGNVEPNFHVLLHDGANSTNATLANAAKFNIFNDGHLHGECLINSNVNPTGENSGKFWSTSGNYINAWNVGGDPEGVRYFIELDIQGLFGYTSYGFIYKDRNGRWNVDLQRQAGTNVQVDASNTYIQVTQGSGANQTNSSGNVRLTRLMGTGATAVS